MTEKLDNHEMRLVARYPYGGAEWHCDTCGRRIVFNGPPGHTMDILELGDPSVIHSGSTGGIAVDRTEVELKDAPEYWREDPSLRVWYEWMEQGDFDKNWTK